MWEEEARRQPSPTMTVYLLLAVVDGAVAIAAFSQMLRIHLRNQQLGWTRQKIFHLMIASSCLGFTIYFISLPIATCAHWLCWFQGYGFILMACSEILLLASFLLLLSFWVDLCHQANDEDDDDGESSNTETLLEKLKIKSGEFHRNRCSIFGCGIFPTIHVGRRQKIVFMVVVLAFLSVVAFTMLISIGNGKNNIDSLFITMVYLDTFSVVMLLLGGALACYGGLLFSKMSEVRSETVSAEMKKVASLAAVSLVCFTFTSILSLVTNTPVISSFCSEVENSISSSVLLFLYYVIGSSVPSAFVLWVMREMPPQHARERPEQERIVTFVREESTSKHHSHRWTNTATSTNQTSRASPI